MQGSSEGPTSHIQLAELWTSSKVGALNMAFMPKTVGTVWLIWTSLAACQQMCYFGPGASNRGPSNLVPCLDSGTSACCLLGDTCLSGDACYNYKTGDTYQYGCTDVTYKDKSCPYKCGWNSTLSPWTALEYCQDVSGVTNTWTCHSPESCGCSWTATYDLLVLAPRGCKEMGSDARVALNAPAALAPYVSLPSTLGGSKGYYSGTTISGTSTWISTAIAGYTPATVTPLTTYAAGPSSVVEIDSNGTPSPSSLSGPSSTAASSTSLSSATTATTSSSYYSSSTAATTSSSSLSSNTAATSSSDTAATSSSYLSSSTIATSSALISNTNAVAEASSTSTATNTTTNGNNNSSPGLSVGAEAGIGVGVGVVVLGAIIAIILLCVKRRRRSYASSQMPHHQELAASPSPYGPVHEMPNTFPYAAAPNEKSASWLHTNAKMGPTDYPPSHEVHELPPSPPAELPTERKVHEIGSDSMVHAPPSR